MGSFWAMIWSTDGAMFWLPEIEFPVHSPPIPCSWAPPLPPLKRGTSLKKIMLSLCLASGARMWLVPGKVKAVSVPCGYQRSGTVPSGVNTSKRRLTGVPSAHESSAGISGAAAALTPRTLSSCRRESACFPFLPR